MRHRFSHLHANEASNNSAEKDSPEKPEDIVDCIGARRLKEELDHEVTKSDRSTRSVKCRRADRKSSRMAKLMPGKRGTTTERQITLTDHDESNRRLSIALLDFQAMHDVFKSARDCVQEEDDSTLMEVCISDTNGRRKSIEACSVIQAGATCTAIAGQEKRTCRIVSQTLSVCTSYEGEEQALVGEEIFRSLCPFVVQKEIEDEDNNDLERIHDDLVYLRNIQHKAKDHKKCGLTSSLSENHICELGSSRRRFISDPTGFSYLCVLNSNNQDRLLQLSEAATDLEPIPLYAAPDHMQHTLTTSMRRLVVRLKEDTCPPKQHRQNFSRISRRRGHSCPAPYDGQVGEATDLPSILGNDLSLTTRADRKERKRDVVARFALKLLRRKEETYLLTDEELIHTDKTRERIEEIAFRYGGAHRLKTVQNLNNFPPVIKHGRRGGPHLSRLYCNQCGTLQWHKKRGKWSSPADLADVLRVIHGCQTAVFRKGFVSSQLRRCSISLVFRTRSLDLVAPSEGHRDWLMRALEYIIVYARMQRQAEQQAIAESAIFSVDDLNSSDMNLDISAAQMCQLTVE